MDAPNGLGEAVSATDWLAYLGKARCSLSERSTLQFGERAEELTSYDLRRLLGNYEDDLIEEQDRGIDLANKRGILQERYSLAEFAME